MRAILPTTLTVLLAFTGLAHTADDMKGMDMKGMQGDTGKMDSMKKKPAKGKAESTTHQADAVVKKVDPAEGRVTLAHEPIKSLDWPAMTMGFGVKDKTLFEKLTVGKKIHVELVKQGDDYVITAVK